MKVLGTAKKEKGVFILPDELLKVANDALYEVLEVEGILLLIESPLDKERMKHLETLTKESIKTHRETLEKLAK
jgi:hypothetical protein